MPLVRVTMIKGKSPDYMKKMSDRPAQTFIRSLQITSP